MYLFYSILILASISYSAELVINQPPSTQSYDQEDVLSSLNYDIEYHYTTSKPTNKHHQKKMPQRSELVNYENVQYAPMFTKPADKPLTPPQESQTSEYYTEGDTPAFEAEINDERNCEHRQEQKRNLLPNFILTEAADTLRKYVPGYNVDLQALKKKLMQNGFYARNPDYLIKNNQINVKTSYQNQKELQKKPQMNESKGVFSLEYQIPQRVKKYYGDTVNKQNEKPQVFYVKAPKVELNLGRTQEHAVHKASINVNSSFRKLPSLPHEFFSNAHKLKPVNTKMNSVHNTKVFIVRRTT